MNCVIKSLLIAATFAGVAAGCATYDYGYERPYYYGYDYGPYYYGPYYAPGYYVGPPVVGFDLRYSDRDRHRHRDRWRDRAHAQNSATRPSATAPRNQAAASTRAPRIAAAPAAPGARARASNGRVNSRDMSRSPESAARTEQHG